MKSFVVILRRHSRQFLVESCILGIKRTINVIMGTYTYSADDHARSPVRASFLAAFIKRRT